MEDSLVKQSLQRDTLRKNRYACLFRQHINTLDMVAVLVGNKDPLYRVNGKSVYFKGVFEPCKGHAVVDKHSRFTAAYVCSVLLALGKQRI